MGKKKMEAAEAPIDPDNERRKDKDGRRKEDKRLKKMVTETLQPMNDRLKSVETWQQGHDGDCAARYQTLDDRTKKMQDSVSPMVTWFTNKMNKERARDDLLRRWYEVMLRSLTKGFEDRFGVFVWTSVLIIVAGQYSGIGDFIVRVVAAASTGQTGP